MAFTSAKGGNVVLGATTVPVGRWSASWRGILPNVTQSDNPGATLFYPTIQDNSWSFRLTRDDLAFPEAVGFKFGTVLSTVKFLLGATGRCDQITNTTVESVDPECDSESGEVIRVTVSGKGGLVTNNVVA